MTIGQLNDIIQFLRPLATDDTLARAVRNLRARGVPALPVADGNRLIGLVAEADILAAVAESSDPRALLRATPVTQLMRPLTFLAQIDTELSEVVAASQSQNAPIIPIADREGRYLGLLLPRDLLAALAEEPLVPPIAGLATPLGVYLSTGALRAGANDFALATTGAALMVFNLFAEAIINGLARLADHFITLPNLPTENVTGNIAVAALLIVYALQIFIFLLLLRFSPITGIHASEHMVVRAIEEGEDLALEKVRQMPRVHPRCGTNIMALLILLAIIQQLLTSLRHAMDNATLIFAQFVLVLIVLMMWRRLGSGLQRWITTRRPSDRQLAAAMRVGEELLEQVRAHPGARASMPRRLWNMGFAQVMIGFFIIASCRVYGPVIITKVWHLFTG